MIHFTGGELEVSRHVHGVMLWVQQLLLTHGHHMRERPATFEAPLRALHKGTRLRYDELGKMCNKNLFSLDFLIDQHSQTMPDAFTEPTAGEALAAK